MSQVRMRSPSRVAMFVLNDMRLDSRVRREAVTLAQAGHRVTVYAVRSDATADRPREDIDGYTIVRAPILMRPGTGVPGSRPPGARRHAISRRVLVSAFGATRPLFGGTLHLAANWQFRWKSWARRVAAEVNPATDVWHAHDFNTLGLASACAGRFGGSLVYDSHEVFTEAGANSALPRVVRAAMRHHERTLVRGAGVVLTVNESLAATLRDYLGIDVSVVQNCANPPDDQPSPLRQRIGAKRGEPIVLYHGSVTAGRGLEPLLLAFADERFRDAHLAVMGYGPLRPTIQALAASSPARDRIHLLPPVDPADVTRWVSGADVAAMPIEPTTLNHRLSSPNKLFEAIAAGVPILGPDFVEFRQIVSESRFGSLGVLHAAHDPESIADALHGILSLGADARAVLRARCRTAAEERWNWSLESRHLLAAYDALRPERSERAWRAPAPRSAAAVVGGE